MRDVLFRCTHLGKVVLGDDVVQLGITDKSQKLLSKAVNVSLLLPGNLINMGKIFGSIEAYTKFNADLLCPISGKIIIIMRIC